MAIINWVKFVWALYKLYPEAKKLWDDVHSEYTKTKDSPKPTVEDFKKIVTTGFEKSMTDVKEIQSGLKSDGSV